METTVPRGQSLWQPPVLILFQHKPATSLAGPVDPIPIPTIAQEAPGLDYECELVVVIGKKCVDVPESNALDYVLGYAVGNDVSQREWQLKRGAGQWCHSKGFDGWAPFGPGIVSTDLIKDPNALRISTKLNAKTVQVNKTAKMEAVETFFIHNTETLNRTAPPQICSSASRRQLHS